MSAKHIAHKIRLQRIANRITGSGIRYTVPRTPPRFTRPLIASKTPQWAESQGIHISFALLIASLLSSVVQNLPQVSTSIKSIVAAIFSSLNAVVASGVTTTLDPTTVLAALAGVIATLKSEPNLPQSALSIIAGLDDAIAAALAADTVAKSKVDPTQLQPIAPLV